MSEDLNQNDFCRVCRCEGTATRPLFYPCLCTGSIRYIHQDCLLRWLQYSKRHTCELCNHRFKFAPIYASDTPRFVPASVLVSGFVNSVRRFFLTWLHLTLVSIAWLAVVPLTACRIYRCLFTGSVTSLLTLPLDMLSSRHLFQDCIQGFAIVALALAAFLGYVSLREQLQQGGTPDWLQPEGGQDGSGLNHGDEPMFPDPFNLFGAPVLVPAAPAVAAVPPVANPDVDRQQIPPAAEASHSAGDSDSVPNTNPASAAGQYSTPPQVPASGTDEQSTQQTDSSPQTGAAEAQPPVNDDAEGDNPPGDGEPDGFDAAAGAFGGEAMNWERLLGLDGSLAFLEHVLWLIALNTLFIVIFAFCPYHLGQFTVLGFKLEKIIAATHMEGISTSLIGYLIVAAVLVLLHTIFKAFGMARASYGAGLAYVYVKVALVSLLELGIFPVFCGFWIDACTLSVFNATIAHRVSVFHHAPLAFTFIHWATGMLYIFYMASLLLLSRSVVRPGLLRFVYHFNDPDFKPVHDMIFGPLPIYVQRLIASYSIWGILIVLMLWFPIEFVRRVLPGFLPLQLTLAYEGPLDYSVEIVLFHVILPFFLDERGKDAVRHLLRCWCICVGWLLGLRSYLLGDVPIRTGDFIVTEDGENVPHEPAQTSPSGAHESVHVAGSLLAADEPAEPPPPPEPDMGGGDADEFVRYVAYISPNGYFLVRCAGLLVLLLLSLMLVSLCLLVLPVGVGRRLLLLISYYSSLASGATETSIQKHDAIALITGFTVVGVVLHLSTCLPTLLQAVWRLMCSFVTQASTRLTYWAESLRVWTRSGIVTYPALPPPPGEGAVSSPRSNVAYLTLSFQTVLSWIDPGINYLLLSLLSAVLLLPIPVAVGLLFDLVCIIPFKVAPMKTLIFGIWEHWIFGIMHLKVFFLLVMVGPPWWLRTRLEAIQDEILQHQYRTSGLRMLYYLTPFVVAVGLLLALPYLAAYCLAHLFDVHFEVIFRYIYPGIFLGALAITLLMMQLVQLRMLYLHIKDEKYLIGRKLINFKRPSTEFTPSTDAVLATISGGDVA